MTDHRINGFQGRSKTRIAIICFQEGGCGTWLGNCYLGAVRDSEAVIIGHAKIYGKHTHNGQTLDHFEGK